MAKATDFHPLNIAGCWAGNDCLWSINLTNIVELGDKQMD